MSAKAMASPLYDEDDDDEQRIDLKKQIGCMNGIFQIFDRQHFARGLTRNHSRRTTAGAQHLPEPQAAGQQEKEKCVELPKEKPRISTESSRASYSSSSCSSPFSSLDSSRVQKTGIHEFRNVIKDSMYREPHALKMKSSAAGQERKGIRHVDSPKLQQHLKSMVARASGSKGPIREPFSSPRFSYDGRELQDNSVEIKGLPRLSLDSKTTSVGRSQLASRLNLLHTENEQELECGSQYRTSSIVAKLMGLEGYESASPKARMCQREDSSSQRYSAAEDKKRNLQVKSPRTGNNAASPRLKNLNSVVKPSSSSRIQMALSQQDSVMASSHTKDAAAQQVSTSLYGEIEKRINELESLRLGKDLRAFKQLLEGMQKTKVMSWELKGRQNSEFDHDSRSLLVTKPVDWMPKDKHSGVNCVRKFQVSYPEGPQSRSPRYRHMGPSVQKQKKMLQKNNDLRVFDALDRHSSKTTERTTLRAFRCDTAAAGIPLKTCDTKSLAKIQSSRKALLKSTKSKNGMPSQELCLFRKHQLREFSHVKANDHQLCSKEFSNLSSRTELRVYDRNKILSRLEVMHITQSVSTTAGQKENIVSKRAQHLPAAENPLVTPEQLNPISVIDDSFSRKDSPSPMKLQSPFQDIGISDTMNTRIQLTKTFLFEANWISDKRPIPDELELNTKNLNQGKFSMEPDEDALERNKSAHGDLSADHAYIKKILNASGIAEDFISVPVPAQIHSSGHLINPEIFHVLEQIEEQKNKEDDAWVKKRNKLHRKMMFDIVDEILVRKMTSGTLDSFGKKAADPDCLLKEIYSEVNYVCRMHSSGSGDREEQMIKLSKGDIMHESKGWEELGGICSALVLDIERLIFKDLINEVIKGETMDPEKEANDL